MNRLKPFFRSPLLRFCFCLSALLPTVGCLLYFFHAKEQLEQLEGRVAAIDAHKMFLCRAKAEQADRLQKLQKGDPAYLEKEVESLQFLQTEVKRLQVLGSGKNSARLHFLQGGGNTVRLIEHNFRKKPPFQEADARTEHSVEMDTEDLKKLLSKLEGVSAPELTISQFQLNKKTISASEEVFVVYFELIKRELAR
jgi:hypothetical protein